MDELLLLSDEQLIEKSNIECKNGDIDFFEKIISLGLKNKIINSNFVSNTSYNLLDIACSNNQIDIIKYFINSTHWEKDFNSYFIISENVREVCKNGNIDIIKYFLNEPKIKDRNQLYKFTLDAAACCGRLDIVQYILENFIKNPAIQMTLINGKMLNSACDYGNLHIIRYFFDTPELSNNAHRDIQKEDLFQIAHRNDDMEIIQYLIMDLNLKKNKVIKSSLKSKPSPEIEKMFESRDLNQSLKQELDNSSIGTVSKKPKL